MNVHGEQPTAMIDSRDEFVQPLPEELAAALRRAATQTLLSLFSLRVALRDHVRAERSDGATLSEIRDGLREMIVAAGGDPAAPTYSTERMDELTTQVLKWSESFFTGRVR